MLLVQAGGHLYGLPSDVVREITSMPDTTRLPGASADVRGLVNLRGQLFAVVDLAHCVAGTPSPSLAPDVVVLVVDGKTIGVMVDEVREVVPMDESADRSDIVPGSLVAGMGHYGESVVLELDVQELVRRSLA